MIKLPAAKTTSGVFPDAEAGAATGGFPAQPPVIEPKIRMLAITTRMIGVFMMILDGRKRKRGGLS